MPSLLDFRFSLAHVSIVRSSMALRRLAAKRPRARCRGRPRRWARRRHPRPCNSPLSACGKLVQNGVVPIPQGGSLMRTFLPFAAHDGPSFAYSSAHRESGAVMIPGCPRIPADSPEPRTRTMTTIRPFSTCGLDNEVISGNGSPRIFSMMGSNTPLRARFPGAYLGEHRGLHVDARASLDSGSGSPSFEWRPRISGVPFFRGADVFVQVMRVAGPRAFRCDAGDHLDVVDVLFGFVRWRRRWGIDGLPAAGHHVRCIRPGTVHVHRRDAHWSHLGRRRSRTVFPVPSKMGRVGKMVFRGRGIEDQIMAPGLSLK